MSARNLKRLNRLPFHEQALKVRRLDPSSPPSFLRPPPPKRPALPLNPHPRRPAIALQSGLLEQVDDLSVIRDSCIFVSHVWEDRDYEHPEDDLMQGGNGHPEDASNGKLKWLQKAKKHLHLADKNYYVWFDFFSVPQHPDNFYFKMLAIRSIPFYMSLVGTIVPLIRQDNSHPDHDQQYARDLGLAAYQRRGWCRLEALAALCPKKYPHGKFCIGGPVHYYYYNTKKGETSQGAQLGLSDMLNPFDGEFEKPGDTELIESVVDALASRYHEYETKMGRTSTWDLCIRVHDRPGWLKDIEDDQDPESFESDNSWRPSVKPNSLSLPGASIAADTVVRWGEAQVTTDDWLSFALVRALADSRTCRQQAQKGRTLTTPSPRTPAPPRRHAGRDLCLHDQRLSLPRSPRAPRVARHALRHAEQRRGALAPL
jgi:hypothetical protein